jgi:hypothetical protein
MATQVYTLDSIATEIRRILQDYDKVRYDDDMVYQAINYAFSELRRHRPDLLASRNLAIDANFPYKATDGALLAPFHHMYTPPIVMFCCGWLELSDDEFVNANRVQTLLGAFVASVKQGA